MKDLLLVAVAALFLVARRADAEAPPGARCTTGPHSGTLDDGEAETATQITCEELARVGARGDYEVTVSKLGSATFLGVRDASGQARRLQIAGLEEVPVAAPRLAQALAQGSSVKSTVDVENVVEDDQRVPKKIKGEALAGIGLGGMHVFGTEQLAMPVFNLRGAYETVDFAVVADLRAGKSSASESSGGQEVTALAVGGGARYFFTHTDVSPFAGGGLSYSALDYSRDWSGTRDGIGAYAEAGLEALRTHKGHLAFDMRLDVPFYNVRLSRYATAKPETRTVYAMPISLALAYSYRGI
jgi:hypothetical protein